jgi:hypothetical protein
MINSPNVKKPSTMSELKNMYNPAFFESLCPVLKQNIPGFDSSHFIHRVFNNQWPDLEFTERVTYIAKVLNDFLPHEFESACGILLRVSNCFRKKDLNEQRFALFVINEWFMIFGADHRELSMAALKEVTKLVSAEFPTRPFFSKHPTATFEFQLESSNN